MWVTLMWWLLVACTPATTAEPTIETRSRHTVVAGPPMSRVDILNADGLVIETRRLNPPTKRIQMSVGWTDGARSIRLQTADSDQRISLPQPAVTGPVEVMVDAPMGQGPRLTSPNSVHTFSLVSGTHAQVSVVADVSQAGDYEVRIGTERSVFPNASSGSRLNVMATINDDTEIEVVGPTTSDVFASRVNVLPTSIERLQDTLEFVDAPFPVNQLGRPEIDRPVDRITLPAGWWKEVLKRTALGTRNWDRYQPWGNQGIELRNTSDTPINVAIRTVVTRGDGTPDPIFRPRFRDIDSSTNETSALLRIPAGSTATAVLPIYVDDALIGPDTPPDGWKRHIEVTPLGIDTPIIVRDEPLYVSQASALTSAALVVAFVGALVGLIHIARRWRTWLSERQTTSLMVISMLGAMMFTVSAGSQLLGMGIAALLGPFSSLLTGLVDDAFRTALMMTLLALHPRTGTAALAILVQALLGALSLGHFGPSQLLIIGNSVLWTELFLWVTGVTRSDAWTRGPAIWMWLRVASALALANLMTGALGLVLAAVLYRFYYADWYVAMILIGPSFGYVLLGCAIALPFARSLREVSP